MVHPEEYASKHVTAYTTMPKRQLPPAPPSKDHASKLMAVLALRIFKGSTVKNARTKARGNQSAPPRKKGHDLRAAKLRRSSAE
jgi:hypothetical protein